MWLSVLSEGEFDVLEKSLENFYVKGYFDAIISKQGKYFL